MTDGARSFGWCFDRHVHLNDGPLFKGKVLQGFEDTTLVFGGSPVYFERSARRLKRSETVSLTGVMWLAAVCVGAATLFGSSSGEVGSVYRTSRESVCA